MKSEERYDLYEAIKKFQETEPLKVDLATTVAERIFVKRKMKFALMDKWLYAFVIGLVSFGLIYSFALVNTSSLLSVVVIIIPIAYYLGLSMKEYKIISQNKFL
jgi:hypothetical protein